MPGLSQMKVDQVGQTVFGLWCNSQWCWKLLHQLPQTHKHLWRYRLSTNMCYIMCLCNRWSVECDFCSFWFCRSEKYLVLQQIRKRESKEGSDLKERTGLYYKQLVDRWDMYVWHLMCGLCCAEGDRHNDLPKCTQDPKHRAQYALL